jgi:hypothetical protein
MKVRKLFFYVGTVLSDPGRKMPFKPPVWAGFRRNLFTFMTIAGYRLSMLADKVPWELCVNTLGSDTLADGPRVFQYYKPKSTWGWAGNRIEYERSYIDNYMGSPIKLDGKRELIIRTAALRKQAGDFPKKKVGQEGYP